MEGQGDDGKRNAQAENLVNAYNPNENFKGTLRPRSDDGGADLNITSYGLKAPIRIKADWDP